MPSPAKQVEFADEGQGYEVEEMLLLHEQAEQIKFKQAS